ncbi:MAG TPA: hypothetical protein VLH79_10455 [Chthonomonadales bacterium]|nr:hypothetical protein [Chthonomonadales bacterium]
MAEYLRGDQDEGAAWQTGEDRERRRLLAERVLEVERSKQAAADAELRRWTAALEAEIASYRRWLLARWLGVAKRAALLAAIVYFVFGARWGDFWWMWLVFGGGAAAADVAATSRRRAAQEVARFDDPRAVNALAVAWRDGDSATRKVATDALERLLPQLRASHAPLITEAGMAGLLSILTFHNVTPALWMGVLRALEQVGDSRAIPAVKRMVNLPVQVSVAMRMARTFEPARIDRVMEELQAAARETLAALEERAELERQRNLLLRPAQAAVDDERLLRPATGGTGSPTEQLLRPGEASG